MMRRRELARLYLQHPSLGHSKTASLPGYEDSNSFLRAFRVWEAVTATEWRALQKGSPGNAGSAPAVAGPTGPTGGLGVKTALALPADGALQ
jgi:hypothetical protein